MALETEFVPLAVEELPERAAALKAQGWRFVQVLAVNTEDGIDLIYSFTKDGRLANHEIKGVKKGTAVPSSTTCSAWTSRASPSTSAATSTRSRKKSR